MTDLLLLRHAETTWSALGRVQGRTDIGLTPEALAWLQARQVPAPWQATQVHCSPLLRCRQTASGLGLASVRVEPRLVEMSWGAWEGQRLADLRATHGASMQDNEDRGLDFQPPGGESPRLVGQRVQPWLAELALAGVPTLAVTHRGVIRAIFATALQWDMRGRPPAKLDWNCLHHFRLAADGRPEVVHLNLPLALREGSR